MVVRRIPAAILFLTLCLGGQGSDAADQDPATCLQTAGNQMQLNLCAAAIERVEEEKMTRSYNDVACHLDPAEKKQLEASQNAWRAYRMAWCDFDAGGGSISGLNAGLCSADLARDRTRVLDSWPANVTRDRLAPCRPGP